MHLIEQLVLKHVCHGQLSHNVLLLDKYPDKVPEEDTRVILDSKYAVFMSNNDKYTNNTRHISRRVYILRNGKKFKIQKIVWCEEGLQL